MSQWWVWANVKVADSMLSNDRQIYIYSISLSLAGRVLDANQQKQLRDVDHQERIWYGYGVKKTKNGQQSAKMEIHIKQERGCKTLQILQIWWHRKWIHSAHFAKKTHRTDVKTKELAKRRRPWWWHAGAIDWGSWIGADIKMGLQQMDPCLPSLQYCGFEGLTVIFEIAFVTYCNCKDDQYNIQNQQSEFKIWSCYVLFCKDRSGCPCSFRFQVRFVLVCRCHWHKDPAQTNLTNIQTIGCKSTYTNPTLYQCLTLHIFA